MVQRALAVNGQGGHGCRSYRLPSARFMHRANTPATSPPNSVSRAHSRCGRAGRPCAHKGMCPPPHPLHAPSPQAHTHTRPYQPPCQARRLCHARMIGLIISGAISTRNAWTITLPPGPAPWPSKLLSCISCFICLGLPCSPKRMDSRTTAGSTHTCLQRRCPALVPTYTFFVCVHALHSHSAPFLSFEGAHCLTSRPLATLAARVGACASCSARLASQLAAQP